MSVPSFEDLFGSCTLEVIAPDTSIKFPEPGAADDWLVALKTSGIERKQAFFDEQLHLFLIAQIPCPSAHVDPKDPPAFVLEFFAHVQVSLEATYISQTPTTLPETPQTPQTAKVLAPPRTSSVAKPRPTSLHPSLFPPHTPNPTPSSTEKDRKYAQSEGTLLLASIWGHRPVNLSKEKFSLLYSEAKKAWLAVYELSLTVSFLRLSFSDPLLSLTVSTTLREKAVSLSQANHPFVVFLSESGILAKLSASGISLFSKQQNQEINDVGEDDQTGLEEVNLLEGLSAGSNIALGSEPLWLPSTRLGNVTRRELFCLPPVQPSSAQPLASSPKRPPNATLRKSFRKILQTVSGFRVRMRTVFVPHILFPEMNPGTGFNDDDSDAQEREAGNNERTVVLCVELENSGESGPGIGFSVERVDVKIGGEGASTKLIGWGEGAFEAEVETHTFPLLIGSMEQYNLLYAVLFLKPSADSDFSLVGRRPGAVFANSDLQRAVAINIYGKPYMSEAGGEHESEDGGGPSLTYPTHTFSSRWNCVLDLSSKLPEESLDFSDPSGGARSVLPEPASPFPGQAALASAIPKVQSVTGNKRHTFPNNITAIRAVNPNANFRPMSYRDQSSASPINKQYTPPSVSVQSFLKSSSTTFGIPPSTTPLLGVSTSNGGPHGVPESQTFVTPPTPAYPAFPPATAPATSHFQTPLSNHQGASGPSIEIRRERGLGMTAAVPRTPGPTVVGGFNLARDTPVTGGEPIIVSVGLLPPPSGSAASRKLYPCDQFTLDIFVFNQSSWTRRFEISCPDPDRRRRRKIEQEKASRGGKTTIEELKSVMMPPGILPLQNRVRVGPLRPSTCQSVRMDFLAMTPGVHSVEIISLTDIETGFSMDLRSVLDIVVHEDHQT